MLFLRFALLVVSCGLIVAAVGIVAYDVYLAFELDQILRRSEREGNRAS